MIIKRLTMPRKQGGKSPLPISGVGQAAQTPQNQGSAFASWDPKSCRVRCYGRFVSIQTADLNILLHYRLVSILDHHNATVLFTRLMALPLPPTNHDQDVMVFRGRVAMALNDLREKLVKDVV